MPPTVTAGHVPQVRAASLTGYVSLALSLGLDGFQMLRECGIDPRLLDKPQNKFPADAVNRLLTESARRSGCETFGLLLAERRSFSSFGPLSLLLRHESSFRGVLGQLIAYQKLLADILQLRLEERGEEGRLIADVMPEAASRQALELVMALTCRFLSGAMFGGWHPAEVHFRFPPPADARVHRRTFRAPLRFDSSFNGFVLPAGSLDRPNAYGDPGFLEHAQHYVDLLARELPEASLADQVRASIRQDLSAGKATLPRVAAQLAMHPRALQRKLAAAGLNFADLVESIREALARDLLANTNLPVSEVAMLVGYASPASFSRWFAGLAGRPPRQWRLDHRRQPDAPA